MTHHARRWLAPILAAFWVWSGAGFFGFLFDEAHKGNEAFQRGQYDQAAKNYTEAQIKDPKAAGLDFNLAGALYKLGKFDDARQGWQKSMTSDDEDTVADSYYNSGNAAFKNNDLETAIKDYVDALERRPDDKDAKYNLELARRLLQQRQQQDNPQGDDSKSQPKDEQKGQGDKTQQDPNEGQDGDPNDKPEKGEKGEAEQNKPDADKKEPKEGEKPADEKDKDTENNKEKPDNQVDRVDDNPKDNPYENLSPDQAARILDSLKKDEQEELMRQVLPKAGYAQPEKYW